jgi:hypothetical protein
MTLPKRSGNTDPKKKLEKPWEKTWEKTYKKENSKQIIFYFKL